MPEEIAAIFSDYKMNLLEVRDSDRYVFNDTRNLRSLLKFPGKSLPAVLKKLGEVWKQGDGFRSI